MQLVEVFESSGSAVFGLPYGFCFGQIGLCLLRHQLFHFAPSENLAQVHGVPLFLRALFFLGRPCSLPWPARASLDEAMTSSKRWPKKFSNSWPERNRNSVQESTSSTQPSN